MKKYKMPYKFLKNKDKSKDLISFKDVVTKEFKSKEKPLSFPIGKDKDQNIISLDLNKIKHLLISGSSGSGKTSCLQVILNSLLLNNSPKDVKFLLIDSKKDEFQDYNELPHLAAPIITNSTKTIQGLKWLVEEMERRRGLKDWRNLTKLIVVIDEYAECAAEHRIEFFDLLSQLTQNDHFVGIHLILSTAQINIDNLTGTLKAHIPTRIAFKTNTPHESKFIIDQPGAENFNTPGELCIKKKYEYIYARGAYLMKPNILKICKYIRKHYSSNYLVTLEELNRYEVLSNNEYTSSVDEELLYEVALCCIESTKPTINLIQSIFGLGFNHTTQIFSILEERKILSPKQGLQGRSVLVDKETLDKMFKKLN